MAAPAIIPFVMPAFPKPGMLPAEEPHKAMPVAPKVAPMPIETPVEAPKPGHRSEFRWTRADTLALAVQNCAQCHGSGLKMARKGALAPCQCVLRAIFRQCYSQYQQMDTADRHMSQVKLDRVGHTQTPGGNRQVFGRKHEEYLADFFLVSRRTLDPDEFSLFRLHFLLGNDWKVCSRLLKIDRGNFFHAVYRIEAKLGRVFRELKPYNLFPVDEYFHSGGRGSGAVSGGVGSIPKDNGIAAKFPLKNWPSVGRTA